MRDLIFIPLAKPNFSFFRRIFASGTCFGFVWLWHGANVPFFYWVVLNFIEIHIENTAKEIFARYPQLREYANLRFSPVNQRRILACGQTVCAAFGIFAIMYFLGSKEVGDVFVRRLVINEGLRFTSKFFWLMGLGYCFCQCCIEIAYWQDQRQQKSDDGEID